MSACIADDSTECDCADCRADDERWEREQGWHDDERGCVLGDECCCPHIFHSAGECFSVEMAEAYMADATNNERTEDVDAG